MLAYDAVGVAVKPAKKTSAFARAAVWLAGGVLGLSAVAIVLGFFCAKPLLFVEGGRHKADVIVLLGGDPGNRVFRALELYKAGAAPKILITGTGDSRINRDHLLLSGVTSGALIVEPDSKNTRENAEFSTALMRRQGMKSAIIVTSWYHSRRALACFCRFGDGLQFSSYPAYDAPDMNHQPGVYDVPHAYREYPGLVWYAVRYGIFPSYKLSSLPGPGSTN